MRSSFVIRGAIAAAGLIALAAIVPTLLLVVDGGPGYMLEEGPSALYTAWPTLLALTILITLSAILPPDRHDRILGLSALLGWLVSGLSYLPLYLPSFTPVHIAIIAVVAGSPIFFVTLMLVATRAWGWRPLSRLALGAALGLLLACLVEPMSIVAACGLAGLCP